VSAPDPLQPSEDTSSDGLFEALLTLAVRWRLLFAVTLVAALAGLGTSFVLTPLYSARTAVLPPQQPQATGPMATLGTLAAVLGAGVKTPADQFVAFAQSTTVADRLIERFGLLSHYDEKYLVDARRELQRRLRVSMGKKDGIVTIELEDESAQRAADMANQLVDELRGMSDRLALTEAQQRRAFFERFLEETRDKLERAQRELLASGFNTESLKAEPRSAAEGWAQLQARATAARVRLEALQRTLTPKAAEVQQQQAALDVLRAQVAKLESAEAPAKTPDYIGRYREYKYQETLFELFARQYELARVDESRDGGTVLVIDRATPPEKRSWPRRSVFTAVGAATGLLLASIGALLADFLSKPLPGGRDRRADRLRSALRRR